MKRHVIVTLLLTLCIGIAVPAASPAVVKGTSVKHSATVKQASGSKSSEAVKRTAPARNTRVRPSAISLPEATSLSSGTAERTESAAAGAYRIDWLSVNGGGEIQVSSAGYNLGVSIGQTVAGEVSSTSYRMGLGFWYGAAGGETCDCPFHGDPNASGGIDAIDLQWIIEVVFFGSASTSDPNCPNIRSDVDCSGYPDAVDIQYEIDYVFFGGNAPCDPCNPPPLASR